ncbi:hypothetical protein J7T55_005161 [Diaporthe amygdali]|uniref:uncharacterized protein n=1 Tax=Phomopsis amygdali TaxID=1214568 RepID=UPI0022FEA53A|nr:uncharacterized protein J7T55_005161 [Diaporthe amygdali]KAJ0116215.1 hypothetical protein J7T55_005161 [Diaporthe amygdali]
MSKYPDSLGEGSDAPQVLVPRPDLDNHKIPIVYAEEKQVSSSDTESFARSQPYEPSHYTADFSDRSKRGEQQPEFHRPAGSRRICGLRPGWFWTAAVIIVLLLIGATAGGVAGGMMRRQSQTPSPASASSSAPSTGLLGSLLSAVNWTDSTGSQRKAVFYQRNGTLRVSRNSGSGTAAWAELDIEDQFSTGAVAAMNATPLVASIMGGASADTSFSAALYFVDAGNHIRDLVSTADDLATWAKGPLWNVSVVANAMSGLAASAHVCADGCLGDRIVVFQASGGDLYSVHGPDWAAAPTRIVGANIGTPLALTTAAYVNSTSGAVDLAAEPTQLRLYYHRDTNIDEFFFNDETPLVWNAGRLAAGFVGVATGLEASEAPPGLTAAPSGPANSVVQVAVLKGSGSAEVSYVRGTTGRFEDSTCNLPAQFANGKSVTAGAPSSGAAAIALSHNFALYVLTGDGMQILEYGWSNAGPDSFRFQGTVV